MVETRAIEKEMRYSYLDYAMSVIMSRAIPDVRDGLKPVQRRILYSMYEMGLTFDKPFRKSARIVGDVMGKYHPHGDQAIYSALVRMAQDFSMRYPLIQGQGNFGSRDADPPGAQRYTEARLSKISNDVLTDIEYETVDFTPNFDGTLKEPLFLPSRVPNIILNGTSGIAVGMATNMPPHNLNEVVDGLIHLIKHRDSTVEDIMKYVQGPDFPTGCVILGKNGIIEAYKTGRGKFDMRARAEIKKNEIIFNEIPYEVNKAELISKIAQLGKDGIIDGLVNIKDESNKEGIRVVIKVREGANPELTLKQVYEHSQMQVSFGIINLVLIDDTPKTVGILEMMKEFLKHREIVVRRRTEFYLKKVKQREHILEGLIRALDSIDLTIKIIRNAREVKDARESLKVEFSLDDEQANAILDTKLQKLTGMEMSDLKKELEEIRKKILEYTELLENEEKRWELVTDELEEIKELYGDARRTEISDSYVETTEEELIPHENDTIILTEDNRLNRIEADTFSIQRRGGKGVFAGSPESEMRQLISVDSHDRIFLFSSSGKVYQIKAYMIPKGERRSRGKLISAIFDNIPDKVIFIMGERAAAEKKYLLFATEKGRVKKTEVSEFVNIRSNGLIALKLREGDLLKDVFITAGNERIAMLSTDGRLALIEESEFRPMGRNTSGVIGMRFKENNRVSCNSTISTNEMLIITEKGLGKRVSVEEFSMRHRGAKGMKALKVTERTGKPVYVTSIEQDDEFLAITKTGKTIRVKVSTVPAKGRYAQGVKIIDLDEGDYVVSVSRITQENVNGSDSQPD